MNKISGIKWKVINMDSFLCMSDIRQSVTLYDITNFFEEYSVYNLVCLRVHQQ